MEKTNYDFLCDDLRFLGFGDSLQGPLRQGMEENLLSFELFFAHEINQEHIFATLFFNKAGPRDYYFFSKYELSMEENRHQFSIFKGKGVTVKEGYNLLKGRAVYKQFVGKNGQKYNAWLQLDMTVREYEGFKVNVYYDSYGFDLAETLDGMPIETPSSNWDRSMVLKSLQKGNLQYAFFKQNGQNKKVLIEANPKAKTINIYDCILPGEEKVQPSVAAEDENPETDDIEKVLKKKTKSRRSKEK